MITDYEAPQYNLLQFAVTSSLLDPKYYPQHLVLKHPPPNLCYSFNVIDQDSHTYKVTRIFLYVCLRVFG
jgi:hypothetical protein